MAAGRELQGAQGGSGTGGAKAGEGLELSCQILRWSHGGPKRQHFLPTAQSKAVPGAA